MPRRSLRDQILNPVAQTAERAIKRVAQTEKRVNKRSLNMIRRFTLGPRSGSQTFKRPRRSNPIRRVRNRRNINRNNPKNMRPDSYQAPVCIKKSEFVCNVSGSSSFIAQNYGVSLLNSQLFYWGSQVLPNYEMYKVKNMTFHYKTTSGSVSSTSALGTVMMGVVYDVNDPILIDQYSMLNYQGFKQVAIDKNLSIPLVTKNNPLKVRYISHNPSAAEFNDYGVFYIATYGNPGTGTVGQLWVDYDLELYIPRPANLLVQQTGHSSQTSSVANIGWIFQGTMVGPNLVTTNYQGNDEQIYINAPGYYIIEVGTYVSGGSAAVSSWGTTQPTCINCVIYTPSSSAYDVHLPNIFNYGVMGTGVAICVARFCLDASGWVYGSTVFQLNNAAVFSAVGPYFNTLSVIKTPNLTNPTSAVLPQISVMKDEVEELKRQFALFKANDYITLDGNTNNNNNHRLGYYREPDTPTILVKTSRSSSNK